MPLVSPLANAVVGTSLRIASLGLDAKAAAWLGAVGLAEGERVVVLRRAPLGGPLHIRTASGGQFAIARELACSIACEPAPEPA